jgi:hypothetical protein
MARWSRRSGPFLVKSRRIADGELLHLLTGNSSDEITKLDEAAYASLLRVKAGTSKSLIWVLGFNALGMLAHFNMVKGASAAGLELAPTVFTHVSLVGASLTGAWFCFNYAKQTFMQAWFSWKFKAGTPGFKAKCLLLFPEAFWHFAYLPANIGYPPFHFARGSTWPQLFYLFLVIVALIVGAIGSIGLWIVLARDVLANSQISHAVSILTVAFSAATILLGWLSPFRYDVSRRYTHTGLVNLLAKREGERNTQAHQRLIRVAARMGLIKV